MRVVLGLENSKQPVFDRKTRVVLVQTTRPGEMKIKMVVLCIVQLCTSSGVNEIIYLMSVLEGAMTIWRFYPTD